MQMVLTLPALERLIGGDTEIELMLRKQIAKQFVESHFSGLVDDEVAARVVKAEAALVDIAAEAELGIAKLTGGNRWPAISDRLRSLIREEAVKLAQECVDAALKKVIEYQRRYWDKEITNAVNKALEANIKQLVEEGVQARLKAAAALTP